MMINEVIYWYMINPEIRESNERYREKQMLDKELEQKILERMRKYETYPEVVFCPNKSCGVPMKVVNKSNMIILKCNMCGFERKIIKV